MTSCLIDLWVRQGGAGLRKATNLKQICYFQPKVLVILQVIVVTVGVPWWTPHVPLLQAVKWAWWCQLPTVLQWRWEHKKDNVWHLEVIWAVRKKWTVWKTKLHFCRGGRGAWLKNLSAAYFCVVRTNIHIDFYKLLGIFNSISWEVAVISLVLWIKTCWRLLT